MSSVKIKSIQISNILSFEHKKNIDLVNPIKFGNNLNILIGPNGAGKSNFLEIVNQIFQNILFKRGSYNENIIEAYNRNERQDLVSALTVQQVNYGYLTKNKWSKSKTKTIKLILDLNNYDIENLKFVFNNSTKINQILNKYSNGINGRFNSNFDINLLDQCTDITFILL